MKPKASSSFTESDNAPVDDDEARSMRSTSPPSVCADSLFSSQSTIDTVAMTKITALEDELSRLREQIAKIVTAGPSLAGTSGIMLLVDYSTALIMALLAAWINSCANIIVLIPIC